MADDQVGNLLTPVGVANRVVSSCGERQQNPALGQLFIDRHRARTRNDDARGGTAEKTVCVLVAACAGDEHELAFLALRLRARGADTTDGFVARYQGIPHAGKRRHLPVPEQTLGSGTDATEIDIDNNILTPRLIQSQRPERRTFRFFNNNG